MLFRKIKEMKAYMCPIVKQNWLIYPKFMSEMRIVGIS